MPELGYSLRPLQNYHVHGVPRSHESSKPKPREKILQVLPKILHVLGKFVRIDNWSLYVWSHHKDSLGLVDGRQRLIMLVSKNDMANRIKLNSSASSKMKKNVRDS